MARIVSRRALARWKADPRVEDAHAEYDGFDEADGPAYWVYLRPGFCCDPECHTIHEVYVREVDFALRNVTPCACARCVKEGGLP